MSKADELAKKQKDISVAEFFERNRHLLGFDNKRKALLTVVKEAVDNSLDACEEAKILPEINVQIVEMGNDRFRITIEDNGPGIIKKQIPNIFAKLLYGSKFHTMKQARGQQGIGISAAVLYAQLTTGRPAKIWSKTGSDKPAQYFELHIDTQTNNPEIVKEEEIDWKKKESGVKIELDIDATYQKGDQSVDSYLKQTAIGNPHATFIYTNPKAEQFIFARATDNLPKEPTEIKPHPYGVELGIMLKMLKNTECRTLQSFLTQEFSRVGPQTAKDICDAGGLFTNMKPDELQLPHVEKLVEGIKKTKIIAPSTDCISPIGEELLEKGLRKEINAEFYTAVSRSPDVYRGIPFVIEVAIAYGGAQTADEPVRMLRFANRVPLLYQQGACACTKSVVQTNWRPYGLSQSQGSIPMGPLTIVVSLVSVWPPFTSEAKEAVAHYPEIIKEMKLALQEAGRKLGAYVNKKRRVADQQERVSIFENYIPEVAQALAKLSGTGKERIIECMRNMLEKNKEYIQAHKEAHKVEKKEHVDREGQISLTGFENDE
ncbi:DNA topoisomerase VI subunit B [Candidatus Woesearchaeota archaeon]|nr:DNA topoisomerase VI subunit B [Candidatus Woesearchaeota archaeon]